MRKLLIIASASILSLSGCSTLPLAAAVAGPVVQVEDKVVLEGARALTLAALAYEGVTVGVKAGIAAGIIKGQTAATIQTYNRQAVQALELGYRATSDADKARYAASAFQIIDRINDAFGP